MRIEWLGAAALLLSVGCADDVSAPADEPAVHAAWRATHVRDLPMPDAMYVFDPDTLNGQPVSVHFVVDSAKLDIRANGTYVHRVWVSEWLGQPGGPPVEHRFRFFHGDHGFWSRAGEELSFESNWLQNHRMSGRLGSDGVLRMQHGFTHGDPAVQLRYAR